MAASDFLARPGRSGGFGALMDEYARAAGDFCTVVEAVPAGAFLEERESADPDCVSLQSICRHAVGAAYGYSFYLREARKMEFDPSVRDQARQLTHPDQVRELLGGALRHTEDTLEGLWDADDETVVNLTFKVRWGATYDPESMLEHAIVHLLRHRRQIERWNPSPIPG